MVLLYVTEGKSLFLPAYSLHFYRGLIFWMQLLLEFMSPTVICRDVPDLSGSPIALRGLRLVYMEWSWPPEEQYKDCDWIFFSFRKLWWSKFNFNLEMKQAKKTQHPFSKWGMTDMKYAGKNHVAMGLTRFMSCQFLNSPCHFIKKQPTNLP